MNARYRVLGDDSKKLLVDWATARTWRSEFGA